MNEYNSDPTPLSTTSATTKSMINLPPRSDTAKTGTQIGQTLINLMGQRRDDYFIDQILSGNIPDCVRNLVPITILDKGNLLQYYVSGDVLAVGSNEDYLRISLNGKSAKRLLDQINATMPTKKIADDIWKSADLRLSPRPMGASSSMDTTQVLVNHNIEINKQIAGREFKLLTGHKKDTVICSHLLQDRSRIAIYGWFNTNGIAIQGPGVQSSAHSFNYTDYSQSMRIISRSAQLNNQPIDLYDVLSNPAYTYLINEENAYDASSIYT